jgi:hypothetical protein
MSVRSYVLAALTAVAVLILAASSPPPSARAQLSAPGAALPAAVPSPPRMFSSSYRESLRDILDLEEADVTRLENQLAANPKDFPARLKLMAYHRRVDRSGRAEDRAKLVQHALWLIEHHPESELLRSPVARFLPGELSPLEYQRAIALWDAAAKAHPAAPDVQWNAASFLAELDPGLHMHYLEATAAADPNHPFVLRPLAHLYAFSILRGGPPALRARAGLEASRNVWVLGNAAHMLQSLHNRALQMGSPDPLAAGLAERYFLRAKALDPSLDRETILPQLDQQAIARTRQAERDAMQSAREWEERAEEALGRLRRLPGEAFPGLPAEVAGVLRARGCAVPQPSLDGSPRNVIRGEFFATGESGWAVLCSVGNSTSLLAFRNDRDTNPDAVTTNDDRNFVQFLEGGGVVYSREITVADRDFMMRHYRISGGPEPPPIDHHGIDDAFLEKASVTWYFYQGKWLRLPGAD